MWDQHAPSSQLQKNYSAAKDKRKKRTIWMFQKVFFTLPSDPGKNEYSKISGK